MTPLNLEKKTASALEVPGGGGLDYQYAARAQPPLVVSSTGKLENSPAADHR